MALIYCFALNIDKITGFWNCQLFWPSLAFIGLLWPFLAFHDFLRPKFGFLGQNQMPLMYFLYPDIENSFHIRITNPVYSGPIRGWSRGKSKDWSWRKCSSIFEPHILQGSSIFEVPASTHQQHWTKSVFFLSCHF